MVLTTSYQQVKQTRMGNWGYGTLYLRTYAKINSQSTTDNQSSVNIKSVVYNDGSWCESGNCYNTLMDTKVKNNVWIKFNNGETTLGEVTRTYTHDDEGNKSVSLTNSFKCYGLGSTTFYANETVDLPKINRMDKATGLDFDIGSSTLITITRYNANYTRTVVATIGNFEETLLQKASDTQIAWQPDASALYEQTATSNVGTITLTTTTYDGDNVVGTQTSTMKCRVTESDPTISAVIITDNLTVVSQDTLVRYLSIPKFEIRAVGENYATIQNYSVTELNSIEVTSSTNIVTLNNAVKNNSFVIKVTDSRGNSSTTTVSSNKFVEYNLPAISKLDLIRTGEQLDQIKASISGMWFNKSINNVVNSATFKYRYKTSDGEYSAYINIPQTPTEEQYYIEAVLDPENGFDVNSVFTIEIVITDTLTSGNLTALIGKAIPLIDHWNENDIDYYNINAQIQQHGIKVFQEQKILWNDFLFMTGSHTVQLSENISEQVNGIILVFSGYSNGSPGNWNWSSHFVSKKEIELAEGAGRLFLNGGTSGLTAFKYIYIYDDRLEGNDCNTLQEGMYDNRACVLRYVIGI